MTTSGDPFLVYLACLIPAATLWGCLCNYCGCISTEVEYGVLLLILWPLSPFIGMWLWYEAREKAKRDGWETDDNCSCELGEMSKNVLLCLSCPIWSPVALVFGLLHIVTTPCQKLYYALPEEERCDTAAALFFFVATPAGALIGGGAAALGRYPAIGGVLLTLGLLYICCVTIHFCKKDGCCEDSRSKCCECSEHSETVENALWLFSCPIWSPFGVLFLILYALTYPCHRISWTELTEGETTGTIEMKANPKRKSMPSIDLTNGTQNPLQEKASSPPSPENWCDSSSDSGAPLSYDSCSDNAQLSDHSESNDGSESAGYNSESDATGQGIMPPHQFSYPTKTPLQEKASAETLMLGASTGAAKETSNLDWACAVSKATKKRMSRIARLSHHSDSDVGTLPPGKGKMPPPPGKDTSVGPPSPPSTENERSATPPLLPHPGRGAVGPPLPPGGAVFPPPPSQGKMPPPPGKETSTGPPSPPSPAEETSTGPPSPLSPVEERSTGQPSPLSPEKERSTAPPPPPFLESHENTDVATLLMDLGYSNYFDVMKNEGYDSIVSLAAAEVDDLVKDCSLKKGHARLIRKEAMKILKTTSS